jgi:hypothetical protein
MESQVYIYSAYEASLSLPTLKHKCGAMKEIYLQDKARKVHLLTLGIILPKIINKDVFF